jgi:hypothetical protein
MPESAGAGFSERVTFLPECRPIPAHEIERRRVRCAFIRVSGGGAGVLSWIAIAVPAGPFDYTPKMLPEVPLIARVHSGEVESCLEVGHSMTFRNSTVAAKFTTTIDAIRSLQRAKRLCYRLSSAAPCPDSRESVRRAGPRQVRANRVGMSRWRRRPRRLRPGASRSQSAGHLRPRLRDPGRSDDRQSG